VWTNRDTLHGACPMTASNVATREIVSLPGFSVSPSAAQARRLDAWALREKPLPGSPEVVDWMCLVSCEDEGQARPKSSLWSGYSAERSLAESAPPSEDVAALIGEVLDRRTDHAVSVNVFSAYRTSFRNVASSLPGPDATGSAGDEHDLAQGLRVWSERVALRVGDVPRTLTHVVVLSLEGSNVDLAHMGGKYGLVDQEGRLTAGMHQVGRGFMEMMFGK